MQFSEIKKDLKDVVFEAVRADKDDYFEAVIVEGELAKLTAALEKLFGSPVWPSKDQLSPKAQDAVKDFGGVRAGQTLYFCNDVEDVVFAMLWPWQDGWHTTMKMVKKEEKSAI